MKPLALVLITLIALHTNAQDVTDTTKKTHHWQLGHYISVEADYRTLHNHDGTAATQTVIDERRRRETAKTGLTAGITICYNFSGMLGVEAGIMYSLKGYQQRNEPITNDTTTQGPRVVQSRYIYDFHYVDLPAKVNITLGKKKIRFVGSAGFNINVLFASTSTLVSKYSDGVTRSDTRGAQQSYRRLNFSPMISAGIRYQVNDGMEVRIEPIFRYGVINIIKAPVSEHLWNMGLSTSFWFGL